MKTPLIAAILAIVRKDLRAEVRSRELVMTMALFSLLSILVFSFALELDRQARADSIAGVLWVTIIFASVLGLNRSLAMERDQGNLDALLIAPVDRMAVFFGKLIGNLLFVFVVGLVLLPVMTVLYNVNLIQPWILLLLIEGTLGIATVGTLLATMTVQTRSRESLLPIVLLPLALPVLLSVVRASTAVLSGAALDTWVAWPQILAVVDLIYLVLTSLLFEYVVEE